MKTVRELRQDRAKLLDQAQAIIDAVDAANRALSAEERSQVDSLMTQSTAMAKDIEQREQLEGLRGELRDSITQPGVQSRAQLGMSPQDIASYSIVRAIRAADELRRGVPGVASYAGLEMEASNAIAQRVGRQPQGIFVPYDWQIARRDLNVGDPSAGGYTVQTQLMADSFIELLRNKMMVRLAGAITMGGLVGEIDIPKQTGGATAYWVGEGGVPTESTQAVGQVSLRPRTVGAFTDFTRKLLKQSSLDVENFVRNDLAAVLALAIDNVSLHGLGAGNQPRGIANTTGIGSVAIGADGGAPTWASVVQLETEVAVDNADVGKLAYMTNAKVRGKLKTTPKVANTETMMWNENGGNTPLNGYGCLVTNQVKGDIAKGNGTNLSACFFGNWADLVLAMWGVLDVLVDPYTNGTSGAVRVIAMQDVDVAVRRPESFSMDADYATV